jgi:hypothetical protein
MSDLTTPSLVRLGNGALSLIGEPPISSLTDNRDSARAVNENLTQALETVLRMHPWRCALERRSLNRLSSSPAFEYAYQFQLPENFIRLVETSTTARCSVEGDKLLSDDAAVSILYVARIEDIGRLTPDVQGVVEAELAVRLAARLRTANTQLRRELFQIREDRLGEARHASAVDSHPSMVRPQSWTEAWSGGFSGGPSGGRGFV